MLSVWFCSNTVKISPTGDEAYTSYSTITMKLSLVSSSNLKHHSIIRFLTMENMSAVEIHRRLVNVYGNCVMNVQNVRKWRRDFLKGQVDVYDTLQSSRLDKLASDSSMVIVLTISIFRAPNSTRGGGNRHVHPLTFLWEI